MRYLVFLVFFTVTAYAQNFDIFIPLDVTVQVDKNNAPDGVCTYIEYDFSASNDDYPSKVFSELTKATGPGPFKSGKLNSYLKKDDSTVIKFNENNQVVEKCSYENDGTLDERTVYIYDASGRVIRKEEYDETNKLDDYIEYKYNAAGKILSVISYDDKRKISDRNMVEYDSLGNLFQELDYDDDGDLERKTMYMDYDSHKNWQTKITFSYNENGFTRVVKRKLQYR